MTIERNKLLTLFHGTSAVRGDSILRFGWAYNPVYVSTDIDRAWHYAKARAASDSNDLELVGREPTSPALVRVRTRRYRIDRYSASEPDQFSLTTDDREGLYVLPYEGKWPETSDEMLMLRAYCASMGWGTERKLTKVGRLLTKDGEND